MCFVAKYFGLRDFWLDIDSLRDRSFEPRGWCFVSGVRHLFDALLAMKHSTFGFEFDWKFWDVFPCWSEETASSISSSDWDSDSSLPSKILLTSSHFLISSGLSASLPDESDDESELHGSNPKSFGSPEAFKNASYLASISSSYAAASAEPTASMLTPCWGKNLAKTLITISAGRT